MRFLLVVPLLVSLAGATPAPEGEWEQFPDGSTGQVTEFKGVDGLAIPAYVRRPRGPGPFPVVVLLHGGKYGKLATVGMGRVVKSPTEYFIKAGWVVYAADYRPAEKIAVVPIEFDDTVEAVKTAGKLSFVDPTRVGVMGGSHGGQVLSRVASRIDLKGAILCAPAALDLIEVKKAFGRGEKLVPVLMTMIRDMEAKYGATLEEVEKDPAGYGYSSALSEVAQVRCPILIINGQDDDNSPPSIIDVYVNKLRAAGKQVETYLPEHGHHGFYFGRPDVPETQESSRRAVAFFQKQFGTRQGSAGRNEVHDSVQDWQRGVRGLRPVDVSASEAAVLDEAQQRAKRALDAIPHAHTRQEADQQRGRLRGQLTESLGVDRLPWPPDLQVRAAGVLQRPGYRIEKIVYQSLPGVLVAAHVYIPDNLKAPAPAILHYTGHWWEYGKTEPDFQAFCASMASQGFVVMIFEAFGQGERGVSARDHRRVEALLAGVSQQGFAEYETRCALHYLFSRKEVDPKRVGMTGASGGGYNTWINTSLDDRIAAAVTVVGTSDFYEQIIFARPRDFWGHAVEHCHFVPSLIRYANNHELLAMVAPKPLLIVAASEDSSFPLDGNKAVYRYGRELYQSYGAPEKIGFFVDTSSGHGYQKKKREAAYGWFRRWLANTGDGSPFAEPSVQTFPPGAPELRCFPPGHNEAAGPGMIAAIKRLADAARPTGQIPRWSVDAPSVRISSAKVQRLVIPSDTLSIPAFLIRSANEKGIVLAIDDDGKEALATDPAIHQFLDAGWSVCGIDPRGIGEMAVQQKAWLAVVNLLLGDNLVQLQARDMARAGAVFRGKPIAIYGRGHNAALAATYLAPNQERLQWYILRDGFVSFRQFVDRPKSLQVSYRLVGGNGRDAPFDREIPLAYFPFNALRTFDLPQLLSATPAKGLIVNPINGDWERMNAEENPEEAIGRFLNNLRDRTNGRKPGQPAL